ncbi:uncharacterized protein N7479_000791 [Penicillium vulpinum]|uniref:Uncharacterized protein n=1 Tax=Penicillium vulpinum TaxID=29845 RepID=A0A1V6S6G9_9EURO|nr:uncharacterized protein N7479_000791 [Penicillium vulpinum]KAJ5970873.1 hypothetical protein N7479_000791 [Penicillium vulpinum]OQE09466.1 hypothetical protein PENVUL_c006G07680 [Penicillium vulpinum]
MPRERRRWTAEEDACLQEAVREAIDQSRPLLWREIAKSVPKRSNKDCRRRWCNSLSGSLVKGSWTESEDERMWTAVQKHGSQWVSVAQDVRTRNPDQCSSHWSQTLNPDIDVSEWSLQDDETLLLAVQRHGTAWATIAVKFLPGRTTLAIRNRFNALNARNKKSGYTTSVKLKDIQEVKHHVTRALRNREGGRRPYSGTTSHSIDEKDGNSGDAEDGDSEDAEDGDESYAHWQNESLGLAMPSGGSPKTSGSFAWLRVSSLEEPDTPLDHPYNPEMSSVPMLTRTSQDSTSGILASVFTSEFPEYNDYANFAEVSTSVPRSTSNPGLQDPAQSSSRNTDRLLLHMEASSLDNGHTGFLPFESSLGCCSQSQPVFPIPTTGELPTSQSDLELGAIPFLSSPLTSRELTGPTDLTAGGGLNAPEQGQSGGPLRRISIDMECTPQELSQIMNIIVGIARKVTLNVNS